VIPNPPFVIERADGSFEGIAIDIYEEIQRELTRQKIVLNFVFDMRNAYGIHDKSTGQWDGIFGQLQNNASTVIGIGMILKTEEHSSDFQLTSPYGSAYVMYIMTRKVYENWFQFLMPFDWDVWGVLSIVVVISGLSFHSMHRWNPFKNEVSSENQLPLESLARILTCDASWGSIRSIYFTKSNLFRIFVVFLSRNGRFLYW
jgi:hypothetical protein